jgi:hypothetical protein
MSDCKDIITKHYALGMSGMAIAKTLEVSASGVNHFLRSFKECKTLGYPLPQRITNYGIAKAAYGKRPGGTGRELIRICDEKWQSLASRFFVRQGGGRLPGCRPSRTTTRHDGKYAARNVFQFAQLILPYQKPFSVAKL